MTIKPQSSMAHLWTVVQEQRLSRAGLLKAAGLGVAAAALPLPAEAGASFPFFPPVQGTYSTEEALKITTVLHTMEHFAESLLAAAIKSHDLNLAGTPSLLTIVQAAVMEESLHAELMDYIEAPYLGAPVGVPVPGILLEGSNGQNATLPNGVTYIRFTLPDAAILTDQKRFFTALESIETLFVAAYIAAAREFAELGQPTLAKWAAQILGVEAEHRVLARMALSQLGDASKDPPNNKGFETEYVLYVRDAVTALIDWGYLGGSGQPIPFANPVAGRAAAGPMATSCTPLHPGQLPSPHSPCGPASANGVIQAVPNNAGSTDVSAIPGERH